MRATRDDILKLLDAYQQSDPEQHALLLSLARDSNRKDWWEGHRTLRPKFSSYLGLESVATTLQAYDTHLVHGLLQTPDYARAVIRATRPVAYVECQAGNLYMQKDDDLRRCQQTMNHILAAVPGPDQSLALIRRIAKETKSQAAARQPSEHLQQCSIAESGRP